MGLPDDRAVQLAIQPLQSVLHMSASTSVVSTLHASFADFLLDEERAGRFYCDEALQSAFLGECCFRVMEWSLQFNICALESSYRLDSEVPNLRERIDKAISTGLFYSCVYWGDHLTRGAFSDLLLSFLNSFMQHRLLFWLEVLNLKERLGHGDGVLRQAMAWLPAEDHMAELRDLIHDARNFVVTLASNPTSLSTPHIYISALPFTARQSRVWVTYWPKTQGLLSVDGTDMDTRGKPLLATWAVWGEVCGIAQSRNGKRVASGSTSMEFTGEFSPTRYGEVRIWDTSNGVCVLGPLKVREPEIMAKSVAFSPDDTRLASGFSDGTMRIWDANKGDLIAGPLQGHTSAVTSVAFSPNGIRLASGSDDYTIRLWDVYTGVPLGEPLVGHRDTVCHTGEVYSVAYSHDGLRLASGSADRTVRVWDMSNRTLLAGPFEGHTEAVKSVSFSPDGARVVSGSEDITIRVWETVSGILLAGLLKGHEDSVDSLLFSVDGTRILSGSDDNTIRVWDPLHGTPDTTESNRHNSGIHSVSLSPDGTRVASGSSDRTICVWDTRSGTLVAGPFQCHMSFVSSVAFSPDGARIISGSRDNTLRVWDASTGASLVGPIAGHTGAVRSVPFSPDGSQIASGSEDCTIRLWDSHTGASVSRPFEGRTRAVITIAFSPDGSRIVSGARLPDLSDDSSDDTVNPRLNTSTVQMWLASHGTAPLWTSDGITGNINCVAFSPDGMRVASGSYDILVLDARDGAVLRGPFTGHVHQVTSIAFSPDGKHIVSGSWDQSVVVRNVESGTVVVGPLYGHSSFVHSVAFSPDGACLISGSADHTVRIWDLAAAARTTSTPSDDWSIDHYGWLIDSKRRRLFWVPSDLRRGFELLTPSNPIVINADCTTRIDGTTLLGNRWRKSYVTPLGPVST